MCIRTRVREGGEWEVGVGHVNMSVVDLAVVVAYESACACACMPKSRGAGGCFMVELKSGEQECSRECRVGGCNLWLAQKLAAHQSQRTCSQYGPHQNGVA